MLRITETSRVPLPKSAAPSQRALNAMLSFLFIKNVTAETPAFRHGEEPSPPFFTFSKNYDIILLMNQCVFYNFSERQVKKCPT